MKQLEALLAEDKLKKSKNKILKDFKAKKTVDDLELLIMWIIPCFSHQLHAEPMRSSNLSMYRPVLFWTALYKICGIFRRPMLERFFSAMRVAWVAGQIAAWHRLEAPPSLAFHHPLVEALFSTLKKESTGAFVHWGVYESGNSMAAREAAWRLQEKAGKLVISLHGYDFSHIDPVSARMRRAIGVPEDKPVLDEFSGVVPDGIHHLLQVSRALNLLDPASQLLTPDWGGEFVVGLRNNLDNLVCGMLYTCKR
jgi:hypothetical protein